MFLIGDIGNTDTKICVINSNYKIVKRLIFPSKNISKLVILKKLKSILKKNISIKKSLFCSVVPKQFLQIKLILNKVFKIQCNELKKINLKKIIKIKVNKKQVGSDRISNSIAVLSKHKNFIIIDFGTATTFDVVIKNNYYGGVIAPGVSLSLNTLIKNASLLPKINLKKVDNVIGKNTINAVRSGFYWGYAGLIDNIVALIKKETKKSFKIIVTGGYSKLFLKSIKSDVIIDRDITVKGLIKTAKLINF